MTIPRREIHLQPRVLLRPRGSAAVRRSQKLRQEKASSPASAAAHAIAAGSCQVGNLAALFSCKKRVSRLHRIWGAGTIFSAAPPFGENRAMMHKNLPKWFLRETKSCSRRSVFHRREEDSAQTPGFWDWKATTKNFTAKATGQHGGCLRMVFPFAIRRLLLPCGIMGERRSPHRLLRLLEKAELGRGIFVSTSTPLSISQCCRREGQNRLTRRAGRFRRT